MSGLLQKHVAVLAVLGMNKVSRRVTCWGIFAFLHINFCCLLTYFRHGLAAVANGQKPASQSSERYRSYVQRLCQAEQVRCSQLPASCLKCEFDNSSCIYGSTVQVLCQPADGTKCQPEQDVQIKRVAKCSYCYQTNATLHQCAPVTNCSVHAAPPDNMVVTTCWPDEGTICMGQRAFFKQVRCNWTSGYKWSTAFILSVTLGGFGADRFYLGSWREGLGKLFSFGGLGVWTIVDIILIGVGYIGPEDGSLYM